MKIPVTIYSTGGIDCNSGNCKFRRECANHYTAGEFRDEDGFTPELSKLNNEYFCDTIHRNSNETCYLTLPENYDNMSRGSLTASQIKEAGDFKMKDEI